MSKITFDSRYLDILICPKTHQKLIYNSSRNTLDTEDGKISYKINNGIPELYVG